jgi:hypothetical protein
MMTRTPARLRAPCRGLHATGAALPLLITAGIAAACGSSDLTSPTDVGDSVGVFSETTPILTPDKDTFIGTFTGLGGSYTEFRPDNDVKKEGAASMRMTVRATGDGFAGWFVAWGDATHYTADTFTRDMSRYRDGSLRFWVLSPIDLEVGIRSGNVGAGFESSKTVLSRVGFAPGPNWQPVCLTLSTLMGDTPKADAGRMKILFVIATSRPSGGTPGGAPVTFWVDDVRWDTRRC